MHHGNGNVHVTRLPSSDQTAFLSLGLYQYVRSTLSRCLLVPTSGLELCSVRRGVRRGLDEEETMSDSFLPESPLSSCERRLVHGMNRKTQYR
jgi:hypothetical protein